MKLQKHTPSGSGVSTQNKNNGATLDAEQGYGGEMQSGPSKKARITLLLVLALLVLASAGWLIINKNPEDAAVSEKQWSVGYVEEVKREQLPSDNNAKAEYYLKLGSTQLVAEQYEDSIQTFEKILSLNSGVMTEFKAYSGLAFCYEKTGDSVKARAAIIRLQQLIDLQEYLELESKAEQKTLYQKRLEALR